MRNLVLIIAAFFLGTIILEGSTRFFVNLPSPYMYSPKMIVKDQRGFWTLNPGFSGEMGNNIDFEGKALNVVSDGTRKVSCRSNATRGPNFFLIGDSQTFGHGLSDSETWASRLQCSFVENSIAGKVLNLGVPGINIDSYVQRLDQVLPALKSGDSVIANVTWNDIHTAQLDQIVEYFRSHALKTDGENRANQIKTRLIKPYIYLQPYTWRYKVFLHFGLFIPRFDSIRSFAESMQFSSTLFHFLYPRVKELFYKLRETDSVFRKLADKTFENNFLLLSLMRQQVEAAGGSFSVMFLPNRLFFDEPYYLAYSQNGRVFPEQDFLGFLGRKYCALHRINCFSAFQVLKTAVRDRYTFAFDGHYNEAGAKRIADGFFRWFTQNANSTKVN